MNFFHAICKVAATCNAISEDMAKNGPQIDLNIAAQLANVHRTTIFRAIRKGELTACKLQQDGHKLQYMLNSEEFESWMHRRGNVAQVAPAPDKVQKSETVQEALIADLSFLQDFNRNLSEALRQADQARAQSIQVSEENRRLERQVFALQYELGKYQLALTESSEALQEARAYEAQAKALLQEKEAQPIEVEQGSLSFRLDTPKPSFGQRLKRLLGLSKAV